MTSTYDAVPTQQDPPAGGTLRYCVQVADPADSDDTTIEFAIAGVGPHVISIKDCLAIAQNGTTIAGFTQSGASAATSSADAVYKIILDGTDNTCGSILALEGDDIVIGGLRLENQAGFAIEVETPSATVRIVGNSFDDDGGAVEIAAGASEVTIGGATPADRNVITDSTSYDAILVNGGTGTRSLETTFWTTPTWASS